MTIIVVVCILVGLVAFGVIKRRYYPYLLYAIALTLLLQVTLVSSYLVGTDIHLEYYFAQLARSEGWNSTLPYPQNTTLGNVLLVPLLSYIIPITWVYKVVFPIMFALVPVILYFVFKSWVDEKLAFLASFFFISVPTFFMELTSIARQQLATFFFALLLYFLIVSNLKTKYKLPVVVGLALLVVVSHYSLGVILMLFLVVGFAAKACLEYKGKFPTWALGLTAFIVLVFGFLYYGNIAGGTPLRAMISVVPTRPVEVGPLQVGPYEIGPVIVGPVVAPVEGIVREHTPLMKVALGLDFFEVDVWGKLFRVLQYATQLLLVVGFFLLWKKKGYYVFASAAILILLLCVLMPGFSAIMNATRFYHLSLLLLAPAFIVGGMLVFRKPQVLTVCLLIPYFLFTSGFMFEATKQEDISKITIPYSIPLSNHRIDLGGSFTKNDELVRDYIVENDVRPIYADFYGMLFLQQYLGFEGKRLPRDWNEIEGGYVFLRERNIQDGKLAHWAGIGLREYAELNTTGNVIYQVGDARVLEVRND